ncbi:SusC/RagA family TonB-linked outer membrane protein [Sphingobacterium corticibacter]|uniref:SusC/RagA family TonB-linked outer membrane protein n=1 Tax=Sphingobacterium corticibacter TaxID=2171749 RepID=A0A2T8HMF9_9SPHI|nr:SusC/RagA family TonB-linked outer membrane protein [Sphingobacterium corticibacter]PVH26482.1 SusC/RagA family TonB-linked outer membrane protein [Sphingobacterium corticibacter]
MSKFNIICCNMLLVMLWSISAAFAQQTVTGRVTDANGPIAGVTVSVTGTNRQTQTDANGSYSIQAANGSTIRFSTLGYTTREIMVTSTTHDVVLTEGAGDIGEVVVTALGIKRERKSLAYAVQEIKGSELLETREANLANALSGKVAGLQVARSSNGAGGSAKIILRGFSSLTGDNQPLIVVDGIPMNNFTGTTDNGYFAAGLDRGNGLGDISSDDIESMSVLKGPSAAALYGTRAGNGVILITTKSGRAKAGLGITASSNMGVESIFIQPKFQNTFAQGDAGAFDPTSPSSWGPRIEGQTVTKWNGQEEALSARDNLNSYLQTGVNQNHNVAFQQQYGNTSVYTAINRLENQSILPTNRFTRTNLTTRMGTKFGADDRWSTDVKVQYNNTKGVNRPINGRDWSNIYALQMLPRTLNILDFRDNVNEFGEMIWYRGGAATFNPYWKLDNERNEDQRDRFLLNGSLGYQFNDWLKGEFKAGSDMYTNNLQNRTRAGGPQSRNGSFSTGKETFKETNYQGLLIAQKDNIFGKFGGSATLGGNLMHQKSDGLTVNVGQLQIPNLFTPGNSVGAPSVLPFNSERKINSIFGAFSVNYDSFIFLESTMRNDWTSTLSRDNRSFFYPSFNLSYVLSEHIEKAGGNLPSWISYAKFRASYAEVGNDMGPYQLYNVYGIGNDPNGNVTSNTGTINFNPNVRSELLRNIEFGGEARFFNNKLSLDFSWYRSNAFNQLLDLELDPASGFGFRKINGGDVQNQGWELMASANIMDRESSFRWDASLNISRNVNSINDIASDFQVDRYRIGGFDDLAFIARTGGMYGEIWGHRYNRVTDESSQYYGQLILNNQGLPTRSGTPEYLGEQQANEMASLINNISYKNFGLTFQVDARFGGMMYVGTHRGMQSVGTAAITAPNGNRDNFVVDGVVGSNGNYTKNETSVTPQQYYTAIATANNLGINEEYLRDATNIRLRNVQLNYSFPRKVLGNSVFQSARLFASCNNVWMIHSKMDGIDPESTFATGSNAIGFENGAPPTMRSFIFGFSLGF